MPELGPYGSVRGARGNSRPYRDPGSIASFRRCPHHVRFGPPYTDRNARHGLRSVQGQQATYRTGPCPYQVGMILLGRNSGFVPSNFPEIAAVQRLPNFGSSDRETLARILEGFVISMLAGVASAC